jgi:beta-aspartyl-peptidase (threonine type)
MLALILFLMTAGLPARSQAEGPEADILAILNAQVGAWNRGDFEGFMTYYWKSPEMTFQSGNRRLHGWQSLLNRYRTSYAGEKRGVLTFHDLKVVFLGRDHAYALGRFHLEYPESAAEGLFTIILKRFPEGWRIIHDHSSS